MADSDEFTGQVAVVTGAASGIGAATARLLAERGAAVAAMDVDGERLEQQRRTYPHLAARMLTVVADVSVEDQVGAAVRVVEQRLGPIAILVNQAGIIPRGPLESVSVADWDHAMAVNVRSVFLMSRAILPGMAARRGGSVVNTSSGAAFTAGRDLAAYTATKGAVLALTRALAVDFAPYVRVNAVCPGLIDTPGPITANPDTDLAQRRTRQAGMTPLGRLGTASEVAEAIVFLASPRSNFCTGSAMIVDGGMLAT